MADTKLTTKQAARIADTSDAYIRQLILAGKVKAEKFGRDWIVSRASLEQWLRDGKRK